MLPELGQFALILAVCLSLALTVVPLLGVQQRSRSLDYGCSSSCVWSIILWSLLTRF
jgi:cytochrome c biogenesis factor